MAGKPYKVGRFAHSLRVRLMREHIGIDVDALDDKDVRVYCTTEGGHGANAWEPDTEQTCGQGSVTEKSAYTERAKNMMRDTVDTIRQGNI